MNRLKPLKVAVVDDDQIYQFIIHRTLTRLQPNCKILNFSNCSDFFNFLKRNAHTTDLLPDIVLLDLHTPFMNAWEFLKLYEDSELPLAKVPAIFMVTSSVVPSDAEQANNIKALSGFYSKPLRPDQVQEILQQVLVKRQ